MWRSFFLGLGITSVIFGAGCTVVDTLILVPKTAPPPAVATGFQSDLVPTGKVREVAIPDWAPWSLMAGGAVVILYSFTIPKRVSGG